ncbi:hypothetical protein F4776DRAFT_638078 [Hypoxylon sp. NC0597]|nr:hypothetical protein F4776DRAFT_638078 [Hypoxylon sp. NC0597]
MQLIKERSHLPIPKLFAFEVNEQIPIGAPFILIDFLPGNTIGRCIEAKLIGDDLKYSRAS